MGTARLRTTQVPDTKAATADDSSDHRGYYDHLGIWSEAGNTTMEGFQCTTACAEHYLVCERRALQRTSHTQPYSDYKQHLPAFTQIITVLVILLVRIRSACPFIS